MEVKYTKHFLNKLEDLMSETDFIIRYEKGNFQSGFCILNKDKVAVINKFFALEGKVNSLIEIIRTVQIDTAMLSDGNRKLYHSITQNQLQL